MKIQCKLLREGGTRAEIGGIEYHFEPLADGAHVAEVTDVEHIDRFLAIPEGYKVYHGTCTPTGHAAPAPVAVKSQVKTETANLGALPLAGSSLHPPQFEINGRSYSQRQIVETAFTASGLTSDEWNDLGEDERAAKLDIALDDLADNDQGHEVATLEAPATRAALVERYKARFGKAPHGNTSIEKIKAELGD